MSESEPALRISNLTKRYETPDGTITAVDGVSLDVETGSVVGLLGPNGAGKTTTMKSLLGLLVPDEGDVEIFGDSLHGDERNAFRKVSAMLEGARNVYWRLTVRENLKFFAGIQGRYPPSATDEYDRILSQLGLEGKADEPVRKLSRGMQQKVSLGCTLVRDTPVMVLDEPTLGLDVEATRDLQTELRRLADERNRTVVLSSHDMDVIQSVCDRVVIMNGGRIIADDAVEALIDLFRTEAYELRLPRSVPDSLLDAIESTTTVTSVSEHTAVTELRLRLGAIDELYRVIRLIRKSDVDLEAISTVEPDLEEVFLELTDGSTPVTAGGEPA